MQASWVGRDDRAGALLYRYRVDGGSWSRWTRRQGTTVPDLAPGAHTIEVVARDGWFNEDLTPASATIEVQAPREPVVARGCGCSSGGGSAAGVLALGLVGLLRRRRQ